EISKEFVGVKIIKLLNKTDLKDWGFKEDIEGIRISAQEGLNIDILKKEIENKLIDYFEEEVDYYGKD
ncbi:MAG TPA: hypothetical protein PKK55_04335, partial [Methanofastidiosum sp.]|nr:hypothetical protein [Methanofastidiosum sp.]